MGRYLTYFLGRSHTQIRSFLSRKPEIYTAAIIVENYNTTNIR